MTALTGGRIGTWVKLPALESVQIAAHAGFDFVVVDQEHAPLDVRTAYELITVAAALGTTPLVRVPDGTPSRIQRLLDAGAAGVLIPHVDTVEQAREAAAAVRFPPHGRRGAGGTSRAGRWGLASREDYLDSGTAALCVPQIESREAVGNAAAIAAVEGVDALFVGAADIGLDVGQTPASAEVTGLCAQVLAAARENGVPCGAATATPRAAGALLEQGFDFVVVGNDTSMLAEAAVATVRALRPRGGSRATH
ncbi:MULTISPECIES: HpcH/HpaI aldolase family protein [Streptomyces]|uniref:Aldolase/citrate lyase family protein n=2 Tax=Streptomyces TaxID=1883 RepID=A0ABD5F0X8_9ACTN|nr:MULTISPECIES: aldolase/citrate lyase family protein [unclassified Streptomyces]MDT0439494.1 aldolase/citrate lyase family protein [Streptomyces sp. DSM 41981]MYQ69272.1 2,4-dihydroxyhept-2-ene-1,7-dioic acid aldolase [Streptomyces sp. SID4950]SCE52585.1 2,4-dihydroxyhept-2-enedioate aldolase [Streptomyces sp. SolWspMP-5a-2]